MSGKLWLRCKRAKCNKYCMSCYCKDMGQLLVAYEVIWPIGTLPIETSPHPLHKLNLHETTPYISRQIILY